MNVYEMDDDPTFYAAATVEEAATLYKRDTGLDPEQEEGYPRQLTEEELDAERPTADEDERLTGEKSTLRAMVNAQGVEPGYLCTLL